MSVAKNHILPKRSYCEYDDYYDTDDCLDDCEPNYFNKILSSISLAPIKQALIQQAKDIAVFNPNPKKYNLIYKLYRSI